MEYNRFKSGADVLKAEAVKRQQFLMSNYNLDKIENDIADYIDQQDNRRCVYVVIGDTDFDRRLESRYDVSVPNIDKNHQFWLADYIRTKLNDATGYRVHIEDLRSKRPYRMTLTIKW
jgi:hypothetical protein